MIASTNGRRPVSAVKRSSSGRGPPVISAGMARQRIGPQRAVGHERRRQLGQLGLDELAEPRQEEVQHAELVEQYAN